LEAVDHLPEQVAPEQQTLAVAAAQVEPLEVTVAAVSS